ncbi:MAG: HAMP domain-containing sensor histidine kinase [Candidatus Thermoplasmatota archaeon]|nr:HAMP domain-containing sensor histidine kinase [Candidatus Thermoplasmatota archaeon]
MLTRYEPWNAMRQLREEMDRAFGNALTRTEEIVQDTLTWARTGGTLGETERVSVREVAEAAWNVASTPGLELDIRTDQALEGDASRLKQLFENLFRNTYEHGGHARTVTIGALDNGFYVEDDGDGFPLGTTDKLFDVGETTSKDGTGFGLSIVKQVTDAHGWTIQAVSPPQGGARFEITGID